MRLKRLELFGFKSFADRTVMEFEHSLTGIVGPNGCGKSNVVDAVRWVLGERRPTSMRGAEMTDVIFKGSTSRAALSVAEVSMVIDNTCETLEGRGPECSITRRVYKSGEGEYLIDGERVRLKDVREMLYNTGLGSRGYSVLEQGRIDAVLSADPLDRRAIFEEAAGISRFRQRKKEAESRLKRVRQDLERLEDVLGELRTRERSLKIQAGKAERFLAARDEWRDQGTRLARHQVLGCDQSLEGVREGEREIEAKAGELRELRAELEADVGEREREQGAVAAEVDRLANESSEVAGDLRALDERQSQLSSRVSAWRESSDEEAERGRSLAKKLEERRAELDTLRGESERLRAEVDEAEGRVGEATRELRERSAALKEAKQRSESQNELVLGCLHERTASHNAVQHLESSLGPHAEREERARKRLEDSQRNLEIARAAVESAARGQAEAEARLAEADARRVELEATVEELDETLRGLEAARVDLEVERTRLASRVESLLDREREREGLGAGAQSLLAAEEEGGYPGRILGILADHLRTSTECARALDATLGDRARALVVGDAAEGSKVLEWLRSHEKGQVRLVAPSGFGHRHAAPAPVFPAEHSALVLGPLRPRVEPDPGFEEVADILLEDVWLVRDLDAALTLVADHPRMRCVTPEGDLVDATTMAGGWREVAHGPVGRRATAAELEAEEDQLAGRLADLTEEAAEVASRRDDEALELEEVRARIQANRDVLAEARGAGDTARARLSDLEETARVLARECETMAAEHARLVEELAEARRAFERAGEAFEVENATLQELEDARRGLESETEEASKRESGERVEWTRLREQYEGLARRVQDLERMVEESEAERSRADRLAIEHAESAKQGEAEYESLGVKRVEMLALRGELDERLAGLREREKEGREAMEALRRRTEAVTRELEERMGALSEKGLEAQRLTLTREEVLRRVEEDLSLAEYELMEGFEPDEELFAEGALEALAEAVSELKRQLDKLGPVNLDAVEELEEVSGRLGFLDEQEGDLSNARAGLEATVRKIDEESERLFLETFDAVRERFGGLFRKLFGGGRADITLEEDVSALEAGIEITARPPGREMLPIGLLSGGQRTMTALALLFAIFETRPSPFCVLDEVDAALDDANIGRFLTMIEGFRRGSQFIVVTHNKGTMGASDTLYGVTMQVRGVSRVVSVELADVDEFVPDAAGGAPAPTNGNGGGNGSADAESGGAESGESRSDPSSGEAEGEASPSADEAAEPVVELEPHRTTEGELSIATGAGEPTA